MPLINILNRKVLAESVIIAGFSLSAYSFGLSVLSKKVDKTVYLPEARNRVRHRLESRFSTLMLLFYY
jgi:hypothetical protein